MAGTKRASPGAEAEKNPLADIEITDEIAQKLGDVSRDIERAEFIQGTVSIHAGIMFALLT